MAYVSQNPFNKEFMARFDEISDEQLYQKLTVADEAFAKWKDTCFQKREQALKKLACLLTERSHEYGTLIANEMGKPITQAMGEVEKCAWVCSYYADNGADFLAHKGLESTAELSQINYEPLGTIFAVMPWNFPFWQVFRFLAPTLMAGNTALLKHASNVPQSALAIEEVLLDAGFPEGVFQNLFINYDQVEKVIAYKGVKAVTLTGSNYAGSIVAQLAGKYTKKSLLELGGSDPFIVFDDADLNGALENAFLSRFLNAGQSCIAAKRFILHEDIAEEFLHNFIALLENVAVGDPLKSETFIGPMVDEKSIIALERQVFEAKNNGIRILCGGKRHPEHSSIFLPTLISNTKPSSPLWAEEVFGPVAAITTFKTDEEAINLANDTIFGLGATLWTADVDKAHFMVKHLDAGTVVVNGMVKSEPGLPFGGINQSGYGRELGKEGILEFVNAKTVNYF